MLGPVGGGDGGISHRHTRFRQSPPDGAATVADLSPAARATAPFNTLNAD